MSALIGSVKGPHHNSPDDAAEVWYSRDGVEVSLFGEAIRDGVRRRLDPLAARNLAALLVRGSEEVERMRDRDAGGQS